MSGGADQIGPSDVDDPYVFMKLVEDAFENERSTYYVFLGIVRQYKTQRIDLASALERVQFLFKGQEELISGFRTFLPKSLQITLPPVDMLLVSEFVNKLKARFQVSDDEYKSFLDILNKYRKGNMPIHEVSQKVAELFKDHPDLLELIPGVEDDC